MNLREAWDKNARGDRVTDEELAAMIQQMDAAMPYLSERPGYDLAVRDTAITLANMRSLQRTRQASTASESFRVVRDLGREIGPDFLVYVNGGTHGAMRFAHSAHMEPHERVFEAGRLECRMLAELLGGDCYLVHAKTGIRAGK